MTNHLRVVVENNWGIGLASIYLRHRIGNEDSSEKEQEHTWTNVQNGETTNNPMVVTIETGLFSPRDYWWIKIVDIASNAYACKDNFYCSLTSDDAATNRDVVVKLEGDSKEMKVVPPDSSSASVSLYKE